MLLKNNIRDGYRRIPETSLTYIQSLILLGLQDTNSQIRSFTGNVITEIIRQGGVLGWQQLIPDLLAMVANENGTFTRETQEGAMSALMKVCEDNTDALDKDFQGQRPLNVIIPKLISFTGSPLPKVRAFALASINVFIPARSQALLVSLDELLARLFQLANDENDDVRRNVCRAFVLLVEVRPDKIAPHMEGLVDYIISQQRNPEDPDLALDAAEFWLCVGEHDTLGMSLGPHLPKIIPALLESMVYSQDEILMLEGDMEDAEVEDKAEDIKPQFARGKGGRNTRTAADDQINSVNGAEVNGSTAEGADPEDDLSEGEIEDYGDDDGDDDEPENRWSLRKCSAAALDVLASVFHGPVFEVTLPYLKENLRHTEWSQREAAVLALGAVADGCMDVVMPHLPDLVPYLISLLNDTEPVVRQITCWTLGRYSGWAAHLEDPADKARYFEPMMEGILNKMLDKNKRVQEAGASAFASLEEKATQKLMPYCEPIVRQFVQCFGLYKDRNMFILYDCVQTLAEHVGPVLARPDLVEMLMPVLIQRWNKVSDQSRELFPLLECLSYVAAAMGDAFAPFSAPLFARCIRIVHQNLEEYLAAINNEALDKPDKDFLVTSLDLISAIIQALEQTRTMELVSSAQPPFFDLLAFCLEDPSRDVRQSAYAVLGDCAIYVPQLLQPFIPVLMPTAIRQLDLDRTLTEHARTGFGVLNNACWSIGEICNRKPECVEPHAEELYRKLASIILSPEVPESVHENAAIALGRLGTSAPDKLAVHLSDFAEGFLDAIEKVDWTEEKDSAFEGFAKAVALNPRAMESCLPKYFSAIARYKIVPDADAQKTQTLQALFSDVSGVGTVCVDVSC